MLPCKICLVAPRCKARFKNQNFHVVNNCDIICKFLIKHSKKVSTNSWYKYRFEFKVEKEISEMLYKFFVSNGTVPCGGYYEGSGKYTTSVNNNRELTLGYTWNGEVEI